VQSLQLSLDAAWAAGLVLAITRVAGFVVASPLLGRAIPPVGRLALILSLGAFLADPVPGTLGLGGLLVAGVVNAAVGMVLGYLTGLLFHLFAVAGSLIDLTSGLSVAMLFDPTQGQQVSVFGRLFNLTALTILFALDGFELVVRGLALSVEAIPLAGSLDPQAGLADLALRLTARLLVAGAELAMPVMAALFLAEVVLGVASRFAPQANVFLLGMPLKIFIALSLLSVVLLLFPEAASGLMQTMRDTFVDALHVLSPSPTAA
jgi:flagellar biosynthetic protein FliR